MSETITFPSRKTIQVASDSTSNGSPPPEESGQDSGGLEAARQGDSSALGAALEKYRLYLRAIARDELGGRMRVKEDSSDLVQATLMKAQEKFGDFTGEDGEALRRWLRQILLNKLTDMHRKYNVAEKRKLTKEVRLDDSAEGQQAINMTANDPTPSEKVMAFEQQEAIREALKQLSEAHRQVIVLHTHKQMDFIQIGRKMNRTPEAARVLWYRAVQALTQKLNSRLHKKSDSNGAGPQE